MERHVVKRVLDRIGLWFAVFVLVSPAAFVFLWTLSLSLKSEIDNIEYPPIFIPTEPTLRNYIQVFEENRFGLYFLNSLIVTGGATLFGLLVGVPAGYGIARAKAYKLATVIMIARMTPALSFLIPLFIAFQWIGLINTLWALLITHLVITIPIIVWVMMGTFEGLPQDLDDAALIDGATLWQSFRFVALPLAQVGNRGVGDPFLHLLLEQLHLRRGARRQGHAHPAGRGLQRADLRAARLGSARGRGAAGDRAGADRHHPGAAPDRHRADRRRTEGRLT